MDTQAYIGAGSARIAEFLDGLMVEKYWLRNHHIVWQTGQQNAPSGLGRARYTHCRPLRLRHACASASIFYAPLSTMNPCWQVHRTTGCAAFDATQESLLKKRAGYV